MAIQFGRNAFVKTGEESGYGTGASFTVSNRIFSCTLTKNVERTQKTYLSTSSGAFSKGHFDVITNVTGTIEVPLQYNGSGIWLKAACGFASSTGSSPPYTHTYNPNTSALGSLAVQFQRGSGSSEEFTGLMVNTLTISGVAGEEVKMSLDFIGKDAQARTGAVSSSFGTGKEAFHYESSGLKVTPQGSGLTTYTMRNFELSITNSLETRQVLGSLLTESPDVTDIRTATLSVTADLEDDDIYNLQLAGTACTLQIVFTETGGSGNTITINMYNAILTSYDDSVSTVGRLERTMEFQGFADASNEACSIVIVNQESSSIAN